MSISRVTLTYKAEKTVAGSFVAVTFPLAGGGGSTQLTGTGPTNAAARAAIQTQIDAAAVVANGQAQDVNDAASAFNS